MTLSELDNFASPEEPPVLTEIVKECIESDSENLFKNAHIANHPTANFQALVKRRISGKSWKEISEEFEIRIPTISSFYYRCLNQFPSNLKEYCRNYGT